MEILDCPTCAAPAEVEWSSSLDSSAGPVEHVKIRCVAKHWFLLPRDMLTTPALEPAPADESSAPRATSTVRWAR
jgi:hypothetical protein